MANLQSSSFSTTYDVFLSFQGHDTCKGFAGDLCKVLSKGRISTFMCDEELFKGDEIPPVLYKVIHESRIAIIVFTANYASSSFWLEVLGHIVENKSYGLILPVFYDVDPFHVLNQSGTSTQLYPLLLNLIRLQQFNPRNLAPKL
ncbi:TMV resistance protein N [Medicago truncatula]|uniref:Disease resistance protein (TIR-NBS-LRR class) n=1 Tax=Medicago truncatula TaxID=3880 RepID=G7KKT9_MEDTR|nr:TMV resistance protein N [Medicago truncatula]AES76435.1 disease resistance protein (TIR-NBS-LRR class) [Medicago truncatula]